MLTLPELNDLDVITWHSDEAGGVTRTLSDFHHWKGGIEFTITWDWDILSDPEYAHEVKHVRIFQESADKWMLYQLYAPHGKRIVDSRLDGIPIDAAVIQRIRTYPDAFAQGVPTRRFAVAFYNGNI